MKRLALAALLLATPSLSRAQQSTEDRLNQAIALYEAFNVEAARPILQAIVSPGYLQQVTAQQRATAYKYLGASYAVLSVVDTATNYFIAALDYDPFTDLDPAKFAAAELQAFAAARSQIFKVAIAQMSGPALIRPQEGLGDTAAYTFRVITTKRANMRATIYFQDDTTFQAELFNGSNDNVRNLQWRGIVSNGRVARIAPAGLYTLRVTGSESSGPNAGRPETQQLAFRVERISEPLEDTLNTLNPLDARQLLPERYPAIAPWQDLMRGAFVGGVALALPLTLTNAIPSYPHAAAAGTVAIGTAVGSWWYRRRNPQIRLNVDENRRRQAVRTRFNDDVRQRNEDRERRTLLIISPVAAAQ
jgi:hypothetical protein